MSDERREDPNQDRLEDDPIDLLLSAGMDDALSREERVELEGLLTRDIVASRAAAFEEVDAALRFLAEEQADEACIAASLETLRERLDWTEQAAPARKAVWLRPASYFGLGLAAAAAAMLFFAVGAEDNTGSSGEGVQDRGGLTASRAEGVDDAGSEEEARVTALGYAEWAGDLSELGLASPEDLEIVEQLELLDFLAAREAEGRG